MTQERNVNFVDSNNVLVGYDMNRDCCEEFGYYFTKDVPKGRSESGDNNDDKIIEPDISNFNFDTTTGVVEDLDSCVYFKLDDGTNTIYLVFYNYHNGYYAHGWDFVIDEDNLEKGTI